MIKRYFTDGITPPEESIRWKETDVEIRDSGGRLIFSQSGCRFPESFSQTACEIIASKYFNRGIGETDYQAVVKRMTDAWRDALLDEGVLDTGEAGIFSDEVTQMLYDQRWAPNSPQWFNTGVVRDASDDQLYYYDEKGLHLSEGNDGRSQTSACFILDIKDRLIGEGSISDHYVTETKLFKGGSGCGTNFSPLRAEGEALSGGGTSSGLMSYLKGLDVNAGTIKSGGTTRRAAKMVIVDADHPEVEGFINWKLREEEKAKALIAAGYDGSIGGEAYSTVAGQNSNNSVRVSDEFMEAVENDGMWELYGRVDSSVDRSVSAVELFREIAEAAWSCGDPGIIFSDAVNRWNTCEESGKITASNPCGEFVFLDNSACNLSSINLERFFDEEGEIDFEGLRQATILAQLVMEASIHIGVYPTPETAENSYNFRPTGLGITGLAGFLEKLNLSYDTQEARDMASAIMSFITSQSYLTSSWMGKRVGCFPKYKENEASMKQVLHDHGMEFNMMTAVLPYDEDFTDCACENWHKLERECFDNEFTPRNAQVTCIAPTGTISLAMDASSTGIEPYYSRKVSKKLADGSVIETQINALKTADEIDPFDHVFMVSALQPFVSGAISKTVNLPNHATVEDVENIFLTAWEEKCKSITVYRDGSKGTQVLTVPKEKKEKDKRKGIFDDPDRIVALRAGSLINAVNEFKERNRFKRKKPGGIRNSRTHSAKIGDIQLYITVGYYDDGSIAEIFVNTDRQGEVVNGLLSTLSKTLSHLLQYGISPEKISEMLAGQKYEPAGVVSRHPDIRFADSISDLISRVLELECGNYSRIQRVPEELPPKKSNTHGVKIYGERCSNCGSESLFRSGSCKTCLNCGTTTGCG